MISKAMAMTVLGLVLCASGWAQDQKPTTADVAVASGQVTPCTSMAEMRDTDGKHECEKRDTARLFLIAGKPDAALRLLCATTEARTAFGDDKNALPVKCLQAVGVKVEAK
jgi:hypothetical protein